MKVLEKFSHLSDISKTALLIIITASILVIAASFIFFNLQFSVFNSMVKQGQIETTRILDQKQNDSVKNMIDNVRVTAKIISETSAAKLFDLNQFELIEVLTKILRYYLEISGIHAVEIIDDLSHETFVAIWMENDQIQNSQDKDKPDFLKHPSIEVVVEPIFWQDEMIGNTKVYYSTKVLKERSRSLKETVFERIKSFNNQLFNELEALVYYGAAGILLLVIILIATMILAFQKLDQRINETQHKLAEVKKMASMGSLVAGVAHEINTPIGIGITATSQIKSITEDLMAKMANGKMKKSQLESNLQTFSELAALSLSNMQRTASLIEEFKKAAVHDDGDTISSVDVENVLQTTYASCISQLNESKSHLSLKCPDGLVIKNYHQSFYEVFKALITNSLIHGFGKERGTIFISITKAGSDILINYLDDGKGIPKEMQQKIFEPFITTKRIEGLKGLGMHIVYNIITHKMGGSIECIPDETGARFLITLPKDVNKVIA